VYMTRVYDTAQKSVLSGVWLTDSRYDDCYGESYSK
jgi:hypothetical protein